MASACECGVAPARRRETNFSILARYTLLALFPIPHVLHPEWTAECEDRALPDHRHERKPARQNHGRVRSDSALRVRDTKQLRIFCLCKAQLDDGHNFVPEPDQEANGRAIDILIGKKF